MGRGRTIAAYLMLAILLATVLVLLEPPGAWRPGDSYVLVVEGPEGTVWEGSVEPLEATALSALLAAGTQGHFSVAVRGAGPTAYVHSIAGYAETAAGGWCYGVWRGNGFFSPSVSAGVFSLVPGDAVRWYWTDDECVGGV